MKATRHNGRTGTHGVYNPKHNDRRFNVENSEHIDGERTIRNICWDYQNGSWIAGNPPEKSFGEIERDFYERQYSAHIAAQNARNDKTRHSERNRTVDDLLSSKKTAPEETIFQIGTLDESIPAETLLSIVNDFYGEFERRFGEHVHILDWALHLDEGTPHIHERHVFDCKNKYGELCPQQEKALEALEIPLPDPSKPSSRRNNRKVMFDSICRTILFDIAKQYGLHLDEEPTYGGRAYLEKQDYILMKQKEQLSEQAEMLLTQEKQISEQTDQIIELDGRINQQEAKIGEQQKTISAQDERIEEQAEEITQKDAELEALSLKVEDVETLINEVAETAYTEAVNAVTETVRKKTHRKDIEIIEEKKEWILSDQCRWFKPQKNLVVQQLDDVTGKIQKLLNRASNLIRDLLRDAEMLRAVKAQVEMKSRNPVLEKLKEVRAKQQQQETEKPQVPRKKKQELER